MRDDGEQGHQCEKMESKVISARRWRARSSVRDDGEQGHQCEMMGSKVISTRRLRANIVCIIISVTFENTATLTIILCMYFNYSLLLSQGKGVYPINYYGSVATPQPGPATHNLRKVQKCITNLY